VANFGLELPNLVVGNVLSMVVEPVEFVRVKHLSAVDVVNNVQVKHLVADVSGFGQLGLDSTFNPRLQLFAQEAPPITLKPTLLPLVVLNLNCMSHLNSPVVHSIDLIPGDLVGFLLHCLLLVLFESGILFNVAEGKGVSVVVDFSIVVGVLLLVFIGFYERLDLRD